MYEAQEEFIDNLQKSGLDKLRARALANELFEHDIKSSLKETNIVDNELEYL